MEYFPFWIFTIEIISLFIIYNLCMAKDLVNCKIFGNIFIIERIWSSGKSSLCRFLRKYFKFKFIQEPNYIRVRYKEKNLNKLTLWYFEQHLKNIKRAVNLANKGCNVVIERSPISSIAFGKAVLPKLPKALSVENVWNYIRKFNMPIYIIYINKKVSKKTLFVMRKNRHLSAFAKIHIINRINHNLQYYLRKLARYPLIHLVKVERVNTSRDGARIPPISIPYFLYISNLQKR